MIDGAGASRATLQLTWRCDNACLFCAQAGLEGKGLEANDRASLEARLVALRTETDELTFVGGEPTLAPALLDAVAAAREAGFWRIGLQTNGGQLDAPGFAESLARAGLTDVHVSLHGPNAALHDHLTGRQGSFQRLLAAIVAARVVGLRVVAATVLTRSGFRSLAEMPALLGARGVEAWTLRVPRVAGRLGERFERLVPRLGMALPRALQALSLARRAGLPTFIGGAPLCGLGPHAVHALPEPTRAFARVCEGCPMRGDCPGLDPAYLARFGSGEIGPRPATARPAPAPADLARVFVGTGPLAPSAHPRAATRLAVLP